MFHQEWGKKSQTTKSGSVLLHTEGFCVISGILCHLFITVPILHHWEKDRPNFLLQNKLCINARSLDGIYEADSDAL